MQKHEAALDAARELLEKAVVQYRDLPVGTVATLDENAPADNYRECFVRDFVPAALHFLIQGRHEIVRHFLCTIVQIRAQQYQNERLEGHTIHPSIMPASFRVVADADGRESILADFGDRAIGRVAPVDSLMWWILLLRAYVKATGDTTLVQSDDFQKELRLILDLVLQDSFEIYPTLLVPDGSFMIDRRMGVHGHPLEIQSLFYGMLMTAQEYLVPTPENAALLEITEKRVRMLRNYIRIYYWLDGQRLNEIHRYQTEEFGHESVNLLNINPYSIPDWVEEWLPEDGGYFVGNLGPGRLDFRYFAMGNFLAMLFHLATEGQSRCIFHLYDERWHDLIGRMPSKICYPAMEGLEWQLLTGADPKNAPWSYHNGGNWPVLLWPMVGAALQAGRHDLAERAWEMAGDRLLRDNWPEYYDGRKGRLIGRRATLWQTWSASGYLLAHDFLEDPSRLSLIGFPPPQMSG